MPFNAKRESNRSDTAVTMVVLCVMLLAGGISIATINTDQNSQLQDNSILETVDPFDKAEQAAMAGIKAAKGHIECHGLRENGSLPEQYFVNGGRFEVAWDDINVNDSTVHIVSTGFFELSTDKIYTSQLESVIKVNFLTTHGQQFLKDYYKHHSHSYGNHPADDK